MAWALIDNAEDNSETDVVDQAAADERGRAIFGAECGMRILRMSHGRDACATVLMIVKPDKPMVLQVVIDREDRDQRNRLGRHRRQQSDPMHGNRGSEQQILRSIQWLA